MTAYSKTIVNSISVFGPEGSSRWGVMVWGVDNWGTSFDFPIAVLKGLENSVTFDDTVSKNAAKGIVNTITPISEPVHEYIQDSAGWYHVYPPEVIDLEQRYSPTYTSGTTGSSGWATSTASAISWGST
jgi:hypothetical protein